MKKASKSKFLTIVLTTALFLQISAVAMAFASGSETNLPYVPFDTLNEKQRNTYKNAIERGKIPESIYPGYNSTSTNRKDFE